MGIGNHAKYLDVLLPRRGQSFHVRINKSIFERNHFSLQDPQTQALALLIVSSTIESRAHKTLQRHWKQRAEWKCINWCAPEQHSLSQLELGASRLCDLAPSTYKYLTCRLSVVCWVRYEAVGTILQMRIH